ncbi:MAG: hypothetical protein QM715_04615 [Nibricoccus sp.]
MQLHRSVSWGAIMAGITAALAMQVLFMLLGAGLGFAIYTPLTDENPIANLGAGALIVQGISAVFSLWFGGWVAGRFTPTGTRATGWLHGFSVWCAATVAGVLFVSAGAGWILGDLSKLVGGGLSLAGKPAAALAGGAADMAKDAVKKSGDTLASFTDEALGNRPADSAGINNARAKREIGMALTRLFTPGQQTNAADNRAALVKALVDHAGMSEADANRTVTEWTNTYDRLKADLTAAKNEAETKARVAAEEASKALAIFSLCAFVAFAMGGLAASWGGHQGAKHALRCEQTERALAASES